MDNDAFNSASVVDYWLTEAAEALQVADHLFEKRDFSYALFFGHLAIEKALKAMYVAKMKKHAPPIHNLLRLANGAGIQLDDERQNQLIVITTFNIEARYPDMKRAFRKKCTPEYTAQQMEVIREVYIWLTSQKI